MKPSLTKYRKWLLVCWFCGCVVPVFSQTKYGVVDLAMVMERLPAYLNVNAQIEKIAKVWEDELKEKEREIQKMKDDYAVDEPFYTDKMRKDKRAEIDKKQIALQNLNRKYFGFEGLLFRKKQQLTKPIQDKIYDVVDRIAQDKNLDIVVDKSAAGSIFLYVNPRLDITARVL